MILQRYLFKLLLCFSLLLPALNGYSQANPYIIRSEIANINHVFDSAFYLSFDVTVTYNSDTLWANTDSADYNHTEMAGSYTFNGNKALYRLGNIEYMQNDVYTIALYKDDQFIMVGKSSPGTGSSSFLPNRMLLDSILLHLEQQYTFDMVDYDSVKAIVFQSIDSVAAYQKITIEYDPATYYLTKMQCDIRDVDYEDYVDPIDPVFGDQVAVIRKASLLFAFKNYRVEEIGGAVFSEARYLFFDGPDDIKPADAYKNYTIYKNY